MENKIQTVTQLEHMALRMRKQILRLSLNAGAHGSHIASAFSMVEIMAVLYGAVMRFDPRNPAWEERDRFFLSKGHGCLAYYTALVEAGFFPEEMLQNYNEQESVFPGHPHMDMERGIEVSSGSLGQGFSIAVGAALAARKKRQNHAVYVVLGDGECNEGMIWEAAMCAAHFRLDNLVAIIDGNHLQLDGRCSEVMNMDDLPEKWKSFGWETRLVNGHDIPLLLDVLTVPERDSQKPLLVYANTTKGKGVSFMENDNEWHHAVLTSVHYEEALKELF